MAGTLAGAWYLGLTFNNAPSMALNVQISKSSILAALDHVAPRPPAFLGSIQRLLSGPNFNPFATIAPEVLSPLPPPPDISTPGVQRAADVTSKVLSQGCALEAGSAWPVAPDYMVTNAHVVAGARESVVRMPTPRAAGGRTLEATVVLFDPEVNIAILHVPGVGPSRLPFAGVDPSRGDTGAVIGYPGGEQEQTVPAAVRGGLKAQGRDIYGRPLVIRTIEVLQARIIPGNSGGPIVDRRGMVIASSSPPAPPTTARGMRSPRRRSPPISTPASAAPLPCRRRSAPRKRCPGMDLRPGCSRYIAVPSLGPRSPPSVAT
jgi:S1-C subfamily serine protease